MKHIHTVLSVLHTKAKLKLRVRPDIIVNSAARFLCCQYQMYSQASPYLCNTDQFLHKLRFFSLELGKLINNDKQMWNR